MNNIRSKISTFINYDNKFYLLKCKITAFIQKRIYSFTYAISVLIRNNETNQGDWKKIY